MAEEEHKAIHMIQKMAYRVSEFAEAYGLSRSKIYLEISERRLKATKIGKATLISKGAAENWFKAYEQTGHGTFSPSLPSPDKVVVPRSITKRGKK